MAARETPSDEVLWHLMVDLRMGATETREYVLNHYGIDKTVQCYRNWYRRHGKPAGEHRPGRLPRSWTQGGAQSRAARGIA